MAKKKDTFGTTANIKVPGALSIKFPKPSKSELHFNIKSPMKRKQKLPLIKLPKI